jgi:hypothetical protein
VWSAREGSRTPERRREHDGGSQWLAITTIAVVVPTLILAAFIACRTGSTKGLVDVGKMVAQIITAIYRR